MSVEHDPAKLWPRELGQLGDGDGLPDGLEDHTAGLSPMAPDTDGDGTLDGDETFTTATTDAETGVVVSVRGEGNAATAVTVTNVTGQRFNISGLADARASAVVDASVESDDGGATEAAGLASASAVVSVGEGLTISATGVAAVALLVAAAYVAYIVVEVKQIAANEAIAGTAFSTETLEGGRFAHVPPTGEAPVAEFPAPFAEGGKLTLPSGRRYKAPVGRPQNPRDWGWEQIKQLPGIQNPEDVGEILETPTPLGDVGPYEIVVGNNPNGPGQIALHILGSTVISASVSVPGHSGQQITITDDAVNHILDENDWDHNQLGQSKQEVIRNVIKIISTPDEVWKDPNQDRWLFAKELLINGRRIIVIAFVQGGELATAYAPTHPAVPDGPAGHTTEWIKYHIKNQRMVKVFENKFKPVVPEVGEGQRAPNPGNRPPPP